MAERRCTRLAACMVATAFALGGCGADDDSPGGSRPDPGPPERDGVTLSLDRETANPGETLELTIENRTDTRLDYGVAYRLERRTGDAWRWINRDSAFVLILKVVQPGGRETERISLPDDLEPGHYRIVKSFTAPATDRRLRAAAEFNVKKGV